jgi:hypothetical protein
MEKDITLYEQTTEISNSESEMIQDLEEARETYKNLIEQGKNGLQLSYDLITATEHPRAIEVFANLINSVANINGKLVDLQSTKNEIIKKKVEKQESVGGNNVTNNLFLGSPADLLEMMQYNKESNISH